MKIYKNTGLNNLVKDIKSMKIQGAKQIALESLKFLRGFCKKDGFSSIKKITKELEEVRPTAVVLHNVLEIVRKEKNIESIDKLIYKLSKTNEKIYFYGSKLIKKNSVIMTHCHSGEALSLIKKGKNITVIATETEPKMQGVITAKELVKSKIKTVIVVDSAEAFFMKDTDIVVVGADALRKEGVVNKIGTLSLAIISKQYRKPFYVVADTLKLDKRKNIIIEERPEKELRYIVKGAVSKNPAFDITPWKYVTNIITEKGVFTPTKIKSMIK